jgi:hypothetical protein
MSWGFEIGRVYNRRADIHARFGGQQQGGILTPAHHPLVIIITGEEGLEHGYADRRRADGVFEYFGEGQVGDMRYAPVIGRSPSTPCKAKICCYFETRQMGSASKERWSAKVAVSSLHPIAKAQCAMRLFLN